jgi:hypothetical protein
MYRYNRYLKQAMADLPYTEIYFFQTLTALKEKCY